ncbi:MAG: hypothetical protein RLY71_2778 [Pseudomonadota bacterium]|jgi:general secretion pathway protein E
MQLSQPAESRRPAGTDTTPAHVRDLVERLMQRFHADVRAPANANAERAFQRWLGQASGMRLSRIAQLPIEAADFGVVPKAQGLRRLCLALRRPDDTIDIVLADPFDRITRLWLESRLRDAGHPRTRWHVATAADLLAFYARLDAQAHALPARPAANASTQLCADLLSDDDGAIARQLDQLLAQALRARAGSVHLGCQADGLLRLRLRIDGVLHDAAPTQPPGQPADARQAARLIQRLRHLAGLPADTRGAPASGCLRLARGERVFDLRLSLLPTPWGEDAVLQLLDRHELDAEAPLSLDLLGLGAEHAAFLRRMAARPHGLLLVAGPAGSGKTSTLYGLLGELAARGREKIISLEDPVEFLLPQVLQVPVGPGQDMAPALTAVLQHDPDRVMLGELRDAETLQQAVCAARAGLPVHAALPAKDVFDAIGQLQALGVASALLADALNGVLAQRLVRRVCPHCAEPVSDRTHSLRELPPEAAHWQLLQPRGCAHCHGSGYQGRRLLTQVLALDAEWRQLISAGTGPARLREIARQRQLPGLRHAGLALVRDGVTTWEEVERVTAVDE